jgi:hypothetical protein
MLLSTSNYSVHSKLFSTIGSKFKMPERLSSSYMYVNLSLTRVCDCH